MISKLCYNDPSVLDIIGQLLSNKLSEENTIDNKFKKHKMRLQWFAKSKRGSYLWQNLRSSVKSVSSEAILSIIGYQLFQDI